MKKQIYLLDGPLKGQLIEQESLKEVRVRTYHGMAVNSGCPVRDDDEVVVYDVHIMGEQIGRRDGLAFPFRPFVSWEVADLNWARSLCVPVQGISLRNGTLAALVH